MCTAESALSEDCHFKGASPQIDALRPTDQGPRCLRSQDCRTGRAPGNTLGFRIANVRR